MVTRTLNPSRVNAWAALSKSLKLITTTVINIHLTTNGRLKNYRRQAKTLSLRITPKKNIPARIPSAAEVKSPTNISGI